MLFHEGINKAQVCLSPSSCNSHCSYSEVRKQDQRIDGQPVHNRKNLEELNLLLGEQDSCPVVCGRVVLKVNPRRNLKSIFIPTLSLEKRYKHKPAPISGPGTQWISVGTLEPQKGICTTAVGLEKTTKL